MTIRLEPIENLSLLQYMALHTGKDAFIYEQSRTMYECVGRQVYGIMGLYTQSMLSTWGVLWFVPYFQFKPTRDEIRYAKKHLKLTDYFEEDIYADVRVEDRQGKNFARFFGLRKIATKEGFHVYEGVK